MFARRQGRGTRGRGRAVVGAQAVVGALAPAVGARAMRGPISERRSSGAKNGCGRECINTQC